MSRSDSNEIPQLRYRQADLKLLPEMQNLMVDYPLPLKSVSLVFFIDFRSGEAFESMPQEKYSCLASSRPLVHVFLVSLLFSSQRLLIINRFKRACLWIAFKLYGIFAFLSIIFSQTIQALETMSSSLHPDIEIILLTFSNRIGVYR